MNRQLYNLKCILSLTKTFLRNNPYYTIIWVFMRYAKLRLNKFTRNQPSIECLSDDVFAKLTKQFDDLSSGHYVDYECCALGKADGMQGITGYGSPTWHYVCSKISHRKYKFLMVPYDNCENGRIILSETTVFNMVNALGHAMEDQSYFVILADEDEIPPNAATANISMIANPHDCSSSLIDTLLTTYFRVPRYTQKKSVFCIDVKTYGPDYFYSSASLGPRKVYFRVESLGVKRDNSIESTARGCYIVKGETSLSQLADIFAYLPPEFRESIPIQVELPMDLQIEMCSLNNCPPLLDAPLSSLQACLSPFRQKDVQMKIKPVFLVKGAPGSGKYKLIHCLAKRNGFNLLNVDFSEIQCASAAQTEVKLRIALQNARTSVPCILRLSNIQIFGKNSEGKKDERLICTFGTELQKLNEKTSEYPVIVIATLENDELEADMERLFIETICIDHPNQSQRADTLSWLLKSKGLDHQGNLTTVASSISDFVFADLEALVIQTATIVYKSRPTEKQNTPLILSDNDFANACDLMESLFSDRVGAPRIPKVYWEDIGGLASLKHEIKRRIELPMLNAVGLSRSGLLLHGPPGTGKTLLAKAVATECQLHFMSVKGPELLNMYVGQSEKNIRQVFARARAAAPCVIFFDELDSLAPNRGRSGDSGGVMDRVVSQLLAEMDGLESSGNIYIIAATNRLDLIDPALLRPGRFDKMLYVGIYNDHDSQLSVLRAVTRRFRMKNNGDELKDVVDELPKNLTGADLYAVCSDAWLFAVRRYFQTLDNTAETLLMANCQEGIVVELEDFVKAARGLVPSLSAAELARYEKLGMEFSAPR